MKIVLYEKTWFIAWLSFRLNFKWTSNKLLLTWDLGVSFKIKKLSSNNFSSSNRIMVSLIKKICMKRLMTPRWNVRSKQRKHPRTAIDGLWKGAPQSPFTATAAQNAWHSFTGKGAYPCCAHLCPLEMLWFTCRGILRSNPLLIIAV